MQTFSFLVQGFGFKLMLCEDCEHLYNLLSAEADSSFPPFEFSKTSSNLCWFVTSDGLVSLQGVAETKVNDFNHDNLDKFSSFSLLICSNT